MATAGNDTLLGGDSNNLVQMDQGGSTLGGTDTFDGGAGIDRLDFLNLATFTGVVDQGAQRIDYQFGGGMTPGSATLTSVEQVFASDGDFTDAVPLNGGAGTFAYVLVGADGVNDTLTLANGTSLLGGAHTVNDANVIGTNILTGGTGDDTLTGSAAADILRGEGGNDVLNSSVSVSGDSLFGGAGNDVFVIDAAHDQFGDTIDGGAGTDEIRPGAGDTELNLTAATLQNAVEQIDLSQGAAGGVTLTMVGSQFSGTGLTAITGDNTADTLVLTGAADLSGLTTFGIDALTAADGTTVTLNATVGGFGGTINGAVGGGSESLAFASGNGSLAGTTLSNIAAVNLTQAGTAQTLTVTSATDLGGATVTGTGGDEIVSSDDGLNLSGITLSNVATVNLDVGNDTANATLTVDASTALGGASIVGGTDNNDDITSTVGIDLTATTLSNIDTVFVDSDSNEAATLTVTSATDLGGASVTGTGANEIVSSDDGVNLNGVTLSNVATINLDTGNDTVGATLTLNPSTTLAGAAIAGGTDNNEIVSLSAAGAVNLSASTITNTPTLNFFNSGTGNQVTLTAAQMGAFTTYGNLGGSNDQLVFSAAGTATFAAALAGIEQITGSAGADTIASAAGLNLTGITLSGVETVTLDTDNNEAATLTATGATLGGANVTGTGGNDLISTTGGLNLAGSTLSNIATVNLDSDSDEAATLTVSNATNFNGANITGTGANEIISSDDGVNLNGVTLSNVATVNLDISNDTVGATLTLNPSTTNLGGAAIAGGTDSNEIISLSIAGVVDLSGTSITNVPTLNFVNSGGGNQVTLTTAQMGAFTTYGNLGGSNDQLIFSAAGTATFAASLAGIEQITGSAGADTIASASGLNLTGVTLSGVETVNVDTNNDEAATLTVSGATLGGANITGTGGNDIVSSDNGMNLAGLTLSNVATLNLDTGNDTVDATLTISSTTNLGGAAITGGTDANDDITINSGSFDISGLTVTNVDDYNLTEAAAAQTLTIANALSLAGATVTGTGGDDILASADGMNLTGATLATMGSISVDTANAGADTLTASSTTNFGGVTINGGTDTNEIISSADGLDLSNTTLSNIATVNIDTDDTAADTLTITGATLGGATLNGSAAANDIASSTAGADVSGVTFTNFSAIRVDSDNNEAATMTANAATVFNGIEIEAFGDNDILTSTNGLDLTGVTFDTASNFVTVNFSSGTGNDTLFWNSTTLLGGNNGQNVALTAGATGTKTVSSTGDINFNKVNVTNVDVITIDSDGNDADAFLNITSNINTGITYNGGADGNDDIQHAGSFDATNATFNNIDRILIDNQDGGQRTLTLNGVTTPGVNTIQGKSGNDDITTTGGLDLSNTTLTTIRAVIIDSDNNGTETLTLTGVTLGGANITGSAGAADLVSVTTGNIDFSGSTFTNIASVSLANNTGLSQTIAGDDTTGFGTTQIVNFDIADGTSDDIFDYAGTVTEIATIGQAGAFETVDISGVPGAFTVNTATAVLELTVGATVDFTAANIAAEFTTLSAAAANESFLIVAYSGGDAAVFKAADGDANATIAAGEITQIAEFSTITQDQFDFADIA